MPHTVDVTTGGALLLKSLLSQNQWYEGKPLSTGFAAMRVLDMLDHVKEPEQCDLDQKKAQVEAESWASIPYSFEVSEKERDACKECVSFFYTKAAVRLTKHLAKLMRTLGLEDRAT